MTPTLGGRALPSENGFRVAMLIGCGVGQLAAVVAALIPTRAPATPSDDRADGEPDAVPRTPSGAAA
ncbi:hypothetical protein [Streptomyces sp. NPDC058671]|uniref:hypothetical protein n=1 Tax=Streptomyces sp. NPDC058671 TaxID=3346590 RepID=UPI00366A3307